jgi:hypothetical protein
MGTVAPMGTELSRNMDLRTYRRLERDTSLACSVLLSRHNEQDA